MFFVDREHESRRIAKELARGRHVIVTGPYGIGRTSLLRKLSESMRDLRFVFLDFESPGAEICRALFLELFPRLARDPGAGKLRISGVRYRVLTRPPEDPRRHVLVLDNVAALSGQKIGLIRLFTTSKNFALVAIVEPFVSLSALERLRGCLAPAPVVRIGRLSYDRAREYFALASEAYGLGFSPDRIATEASATGGYPLGMWEAVERARRRSSPLPDERGRRRGNGFDASSSQER